MATWRLTYIVLTHSSGVRMPVEESFIGTRSEARAHASDILHDVGRTFVKMDPKSPKVMLDRWDRHRGGKVHSEVMYLSEGRVLILGDDAVTRVYAPTTGKVRRNHH